VRPLAGIPAKGFEIEAATDTKVAHCPSSDLFLRSGVMAYDRMRENEITVGLASDVAAGPELKPLGSDESG
jgi:guanine deaminase